MSTYEELEEAWGKLIPLGNPLKGYADVQDELLSTLRDINKDVSESGELSSGEGKRLLFRLIQLLGKQTAYIKKFVNYADISAECNVILVSYVKELTEKDLALLKERQKSHDRDSL